MKKIKTSNEEQKIRRVIFTIFIFFAKLFHFFIKNVIYKQDPMPISKIMLKARAGG
jgi:hypothetical protein